MRDESASPSELAHDRARHDLDLDVEIADELLDDEELLIVLLAEHRHVRRGLQQELGHNRGHAVEMIGSGRAAEILGEARQAHFGGEARRVHFLAARGIEEMGGGCRELLPVGRLVAGVAREILARPKLDGIEENRDHHARGVALGDVGQREMARMQRAHGGHERDGFARFAPCGNAGSQVVERPDSRDWGGH